MLEGSNAAFGAQQANNAICPEPYRHEPARFYFRRLRLFSFKTAYH